MTTTTPDCCAGFEAAAASRRTMLKGALGLGAGLAATQVFGESVLQASHAGVRGGNVLVVLSLRGGIDGLGVVVPHGAGAADQMRTLRPTTKLATSALVRPDAMFGLHPKLAPLAPLWDSGELAAIQAVGLPAPNRSHFAAIEEVEDAAPGSQLRTGWINRMIGTANTSGAVSANGGVMDAVGLGQPFPTTALTGDAPVLTASSLDGLKVAGLDDGYVTGRYDSLATSWTGAQGPLARAAREAVGISRSTNGKISGATSAAAYPNEWYDRPFAEPLKSAAGLVRADLGTDVIAIDAGSWDYHNNYGTADWGSMQTSLSGLARSLAAFFADLGPLRSRVTVVTISEFGRRVRENGNAGFDHGWANMMLVMGGGVKGGKYYGRWPGLAESEQVDGDLKVTTDYRSVLWEIVERRFAHRSLPTMFPGFNDLSRLGFMA
ncbi:DUF1501 domain-containing protein [Nocardioides marmoraquaticus]